jgi:hypothetical protein
MTIHSIKCWRILAVLLILPMLALSLAAQRGNNTLTVAGQQGSARVIQVGGHNYVDVEGLARITNGSIRFSGNQIVLTLPDSGSDTAAAAPLPTGFSKEFVSAGIEAMGELREWHAALRNAIEHSYPLNEAWLANFRNRTQQALRLTSVAANSDADKGAIPFLTDEFNNMSKLSDNYLQMAKSMNYIDPNALENDPLDQKIRDCGHALASIATTNQFTDDGSCQ